MSYKNSDLDLLSDLLIIGKIKELSNLEDFDLARGAVKQITTGDVTSGVRVRLDLKSEWNAFLASMLTSRELGTDAVDADEYG